MMTCQHKYWDHNPSYHYRICKYCRLKQYSYTKKWENEMSCSQFIYQWVQGMDGSISMDFKYKFEYQCYENWGLQIFINFPEDAKNPWNWGENCEYFKDRRVHPLAGKTFGPFGNFNQAHNGLNKELEKIKDTYQ